MPTQDISENAPPLGAPGTAPAASEELKNAADEARSALDEVKEEVGEQAEKLKQEVQAQLGGAADKAKAMAADQKDRAAGQLGGISGAVSRVADELGRDEATAGIAGYAHDLAGGIRRVSDTVKNNNVDDLIAMSEDFGRRQPIAFLGAAALAGFVASRFVLASAQRRSARANSPVRTEAGFGAAAGSGPTGNNEGGMTR